MNYIFVNASMWNIVIRYANQMTVKIIRMNVKRDWIRINILISYRRNTKLKALLN